MVINAAMNTVLMLRTSAEVTVQRPLFASKETRSPWTSEALLQRHADACRCLCSCTSGWQRIMDG